MNTIYSLEWSEVPGAAWIETTDDFPGYIITNCPVCRNCGLEKLPSHVTPRVELHVHKPGRVGDIIFLAPCPNAFSERARRAIARAGLKGVRFVKPVGVKLDGKGPRYAETLRQINDVVKPKIMHATGDGGSIARTNKVRLKYHCEYCGSRDWTLPRGKVKVSRAEWDGSDFFRVREYGPLFLTQRAVDVLMSAGLDNFAARPRGIFVR